MMRFNRQYLMLILYGVFLVVAVAGGWHVINTFKGVEKNITSKILDHHEELTRLNTALGRFQGKLNVITVAPKAENLDELWLELDTTYAILHSIDLEQINSFVEIRDEISKILNVVEALLEAPGPLDVDKAGYVSDRLAYTKNDLEQLYLSANNKVVGLLREQSQALANVGDTIVLLLALLLFAATLMIASLYWVRRSIELRERSAEQFRSMVESAGDAIYIHDRYGKIFGVNQVASEQTGYSREELMASSVAQLDAKIDFDNLRETWDLGEADPSIYPMTLETAHRRKDGTIFSIEVRISLIPAEEGTLFVAMVRDITERAAAEKKQREMYAQLERHAEDLSESRKMFETQAGEMAQLAEEQAAFKEIADKANRAKSDFLSSMSHELRTPMNAILGFAQMLDYNPKEPLSSLQKESIDHIMKGGHHLLDLINDILDLAKIEAGKVDFSIENISPSNILEECLSLITKMAAEHGIKITVPDPSAKVPRVRADHTRLKQVLLNLMSNAVKYNRENGTVSISFKETANAMLRIAVSDTGDGISKDDQSKLFKPFSRLGAENTEIEGTGIGLVVCKDLVELMNGAVGLESEVGKGSTFWIELPRAEGDQDDAQVVVDAVAAQPKERLPDVSGTMLYVEDNPDNLKLMELIISRVDGLSMISTHTGELGIELARAERPDLIILDINLPGMSGFEALKKLRDCDETKNIPVLALSAAATQRDIDKGLEAGFLRYLTKPIMVPEIIVAIKSALEEHG